VPPMRAEWFAKFDQLTDEDEEAADAYYQAVLGAETVVVGTVRAGSAGVASGGVRALGAADDAEADARGGGAPPARAAGGDSGWREAHIASQPSFEARSGVEEIEAGRERVRLR
jgi:hypothetical protein